MRHRRDRLRRSVWCSLLVMGAMAIAFQSVWPTKLAAQQASAQTPGADEVFLGVRLGPSPTTGVLVREVMPGGPADTADIRPGDYILSVDGTTITSREELNRSLDRKKPGSTAKLMIWRNRQKRELTVSFPKRDDPRWTGGWYDPRRSGDSRYRNFRPYPPGYYYSRPSFRVGPGYYDVPGRYYDPYGPYYGPVYPPYDRRGYSLQLGRFRLDYWD